MFLEKENRGKIFEGFVIVFYYISELDVVVLRSYFVFFSFF